MAAHTQGRLTLADENNQCCTVLIGNQHNLTCSLDRQDASTGKVVIERAEMLANAHRIAACWNACDGLTSEQLERLGTLDRAIVSRYVATSRLIADLTAHRNDLLEALQGLMAVINDSLGVSGYHLNGNVAEWGEFEVVHAAQVAVDKATGHSIKHLPADDTEGGAV